MSLLCLSPLITTPAVRNCLVKRSRKGYNVPSWLKFLVIKGPLIIASVALLTMMMIVAVHVIGRALFNVPLFGGVELISLSGVFLISFGLAYAQWERVHISIELMIRRLPQRFQLAFAVSSLATSLLATALLAWGGVVLVWDAVVKPGSYTLILHLPSVPFKVVWVVGCITLWAYFAYHLIEALRTEREK